MYIPSLAFLTCVSLAAAAPLANPAPIFFKASDPSFQYIGRFQPGADGAVLFDMPGCEIRARLTLTATATVSATIAQKHLAAPAGGGNTKNSGFEANSFVVWVDGERQGPGGHNATFSTNKTQSEAMYTYDLVGKPLAAGTHDIRILKATEADWNGGSPAPNYVTFAGLQVAEVAGGHVHEGVAALGPPPALPTRKIEFLGDSITAGFCNMCKQPGPMPLARSHNEAFGATWDFQIGELLKAQVHTAAWSGLGMIHNCCGGNTTMPPVYTRTLATVNVDNTWDWSRWQADALVINLGTNDGGHANDPDYVSKYTEVVMDAAKHYGNKLHVFLACGPMSTTYCAPVQKVIANVVPHGVHAHFLDQRGFLNGTFGPACCGHPSIEVDTAMATSGAAFIKSTLGWA